LIVQTAPRSPIWSLLAPDRSNVFNHHCRRARRGRRPPTPGRRLKEKEGRPNCCCRAVPARIVRNGSALTRWRRKLQYFSKSADLNRGATAVPHIAAGKAGAIAPSPSLPLRASVT
jgi:hypothetical protein